MKMQKFLILLGLILGAAGCVAAHLTPTGRRVVVIGSAPDGERCTNLGPITGLGGGILGGVYVSNDRLIDYAYNDLKNKAAALHATHVQVSAPTLGGYDGTTSTATLSGIAFRCGSAAQPSARR